MKVSCVKDPFLRDNFLNFTSNYKELREIGSMAIWSLSSWKLGNGVDKLRDDNFLTYWQLVEIFIFLLTI